MFVAILVVICHFLAWLYSIRRAIFFRMLQSWRTKGRPVTRCFRLGSSLGDVSAWPLRRHEATEWVPVAMLDVCIQVGGGARQKIGATFSDEFGLTGLLRVLRVVLPGRILLAGYLEVALVGLETDVPR
jgi:hypothetical protein